MIPPVLIFLGSWFSITGGVYMLFVMAEETLQKNDRDHIAIWLLGADLPEDLNWPSMFVALFDRVFTEKHFSLKCFRRSSVASVAAVVVITLTVMAGDPPIYDEVFEDDIITIVMLTAIVIFAFVFIMLAFNLLPDYLSLYETRLVLGFMAKSDGRLRTFALLLFDLAATALISFVVGFVVVLGLVGIIMGGDNTFAEPAEAFWQGLTFSGPGAFFSIFIYSTFLTSVWLWLYALSGVLVKAIARSRKGLHFLQKHLNLEKHPLRSMGFVLMLLVTVVYVVWGAVLVF